MIVIGAMLTTFEGRGDEYQEKLKELAVEHAGSFHFMEIEKIDQWRNLDSDLGGF